MKRWKTVVLACLLCAAAACGGANNANVNLALQDMGRNTVLLPPDAEPEYILTPRAEEQTYTAEDGTVLAECGYTLLELSVSNPDKLSEDTAAQARQAVDTFNERMERRLQDAVAFGEELGNMARGVYEDGHLDHAYINQTWMSALLQGRIYSIRVSSSGYTGGAHTNSYTDSYLFDLKLGQFIDPAQVADDPVAFQKGAAELLLAKAEAQDEEVRSGYYPEYAEVVTHWYEGTVLFDSEGMTVVYSPYELGPYSLGTVELQVGYDELAELLGPGGLARLGLAEEEAE